MIASVSTTQAPGEVRHRTHLAGFGPAGPIASDRMTEMTRSAAAVLGMLFLGARSGYDTLRAGRLSLRHFAPVSPRQVYGELRDAELEGFVVGHDESQGDRRRRAVELTDAGRAALRDWLATDASSEEFELRDALLLRLFLADAGPEGTRQHVLRALRERSLHLRSHLDHDVMPVAIRNAERSGFTSPLLVGQFLRDLHEWIEGWCVQQEGTDDRTTS